MYPVGIWALVPSVSERGESIQSAARIPKPWSVHTSRVHSRCGELNQAGGIEEKPVPGKMRCSVRKTCSRCKIRADLRYKIANAPSGVKRNTE